jgi:gamma-glutamyltranspeptidase/glutathione hydrolase
MSARAFRSTPTDPRTYHPRLLGTRGAVTAEHYLAADAGADMLKAGGNAVDAAVAAVLVEGLLNPQMNSIGGECPLLIHMADGNGVVAINGNMAAPAAATPEAFGERGYCDMPDEGILAAGVPATAGALITALKLYGTMSFADVAAPAIELARDGAPLHCGVLSQDKFGVRALAEKFRTEWPASADLYLVNGEVPAEGDIFRNPALAAMLDRLAHVERTSSGDRSARIGAVYNEFYRGDIAAEIATFSAERDGFLSRGDLASYETHIEKPLSIQFGDATLFKCGFWTQGPTVLQTLAIMAPFDPASLGHNSADYLHLLIESLKLAYADREQYYGDARFANIPEQGLLSDAYARARGSLIEMDRAHPDLRPGDPQNGGALLPYDQWLGGKAWGPGTVHVDVVDRYGNMVAATPSGGWIKSSEVMPRLGFSLGNRMMTFYLGPQHHPNVVAPFKRPRTTISPSLAFRKGKPWMVFGSMGGDQQDQWQLQFFLNRTLFGMTIQEAIEAPKLSSEHFPGFFAPHDHFPNKVRIEPRVGEQALADLRRRGHDVEVAIDWSEGYLLAASRDPDTGVMEAGCDPRGTKGEVFPAYALCW